MYHEILKLLVKQYMYVYINLKRVSRTTSTFSLIKLSSLGVYTKLHRKNHVIQVINLIRIRNNRLVSIACYNTKQLIFELSQQPNTLIILSN